MLRITFAEAIIGQSYKSPRVGLCDIVECVVRDEYAQTYNIRVRNRLTGHHYWATIERCND